MDVAALILWVITAGGGFVLLGTWLAKGGTRQPGRSSFPPALIFGHFLLAATGLVLWIIYLFIDSRALAWVAFVLLLAVAVLGFTMLGKWLAVRKRPVGVDETAAPERHFPVPVVAGHGVFAATTLVLVLLAALEIGS
jgi:hypothetical protein